MVLLKQAADGEGTGGFVAVDADGDVEILLRVRVGSAVGTKVQAAGLEKSVALPAVVKGEATGFGADVVDIDGFAMISAFVAAETVDQAIAGSHVSSTEHPQPPPSFSSWSLKPCLSQFWRGLRNKWRQERQQRN